MYTEAQVNELNQDLPEHGHIEWIEGRGWSSQLWRDLYKQGVRSRVSPAGFVTAIDANGVEMASGLGRVNMLASLARLMR